MSYSTNPLLPRARMSAVILVRKGWSVRQVARHLSLSPGTVSKWVKKAPTDARCGIPTLSSRPHHSPNHISTKIEEAILAERRKHQRCGQVIHHQLVKQGIRVSLSTVQRVLSRNGLTKKYSPWKRRHTQLPRPEITNPGDLIELDTIHEMINPSQRMYAYALIDIATRWAWAWSSSKINARLSLKFVKLAQNNSCFSFKQLQTDHGSEFSNHFTERVDIPHRHIRVRKPSENGHVERFNRTLKEECFNYLVRHPKYYNQALEEWLKYYNEQRPHMGINYLTPMEKVSQLFPRS